MLRPTTAAAIAGADRRWRVLLAICAAMLLLVAGHGAVASAATVVTDPATNVTATSATLNTTVNPQDDPQYYVGFYWGKTTAYEGPWVFVSLSEPLTGSSDIPLSAEVTGLEPKTTYHFAAWTYGSAWLTGDDQTFTTDALAPTLSAIHADPVSSTSATIHAQINANNSDTTYYVEYGTTAAYGSSTTPQDIGSYYADADQTTNLTGLQPDTVYHYRVIADNGVGAPTTSPDMTFKTAPATAPTGTATAISAVLQGTVDVLGRGTYHFEYGETTAYGMSTPEVRPPDLSGDQTVTAPIDGLQPGTTYHVRLVSTTANGDRTFTDDGTFTTLPAPSVLTGAATDVGRNSATLHGTVDTHGAGGTYWFRVTGLNSTIVRETPAQNITSDGPADVAAAIDGLPDGHTYQVVLVAAVGGTTTYGDATATQFSTPAVPPIVPRAVDSPGNPYGCAAPHLAAPAKPATAGQAYTLTGSDLGVGGAVRLGGGMRATPSAWSAGAVTITVPDDASGRVSVTVDCGRESNAVTLTVAAAPDNTITVLSAQAKRGHTTGKVRVKVAGAGAIVVRGRLIATAKRVVAKGGTYTITVKLTRAARAKLRQHGRQSVGASITASFTPTGGSTGVDSAQLTFRKRARAT